MDKYFISNNGVSRLYGASDSTEATDIVVVDTRIKEKKDKKKRGRQCDGRKN